MKLTEPESNVKACVYASLGMGYLLGAKCFESHMITKPLIFIIEPDDSAWVLQAPDDAVEPKK